MAYTSQAFQGQEASKLITYVMHTVLQAGSVRIDICTRSLLTHPAILPDVTDMYKVLTQNLYRTLHLSLSHALYDLLSNLLLLSIS
jgi:hypothetical protein